MAVLDRPLPRGGSTGLAPKDKPKAKEKYPAKALATDEQQWARVALLSFHFCEGLVTTTGQISLFLTGQKSAGWRMDIEE